MKAAIFAFTKNSAPTSSRNAGTYFCSLGAQRGASFRHRQTSTLAGKGRYLLQPKGESGIWEGFFPEIGKGALYKYHIASRFQRLSGR